MEAERRTEKEKEGEGGKSVSFWGILCKNDLPAHFWRFFLRRYSSVPVEMRVIRMRMFQGTKGRRTLPVSL